MSLHHFSDKDDILQCGRKRRSLEFLSEQERILDEIGASTRVTSKAEGVYHAFFDAARMEKKYSPYKAHLLVEHSQKEKNNIKKIIVDNICFYIRQELYVLRDAIQNSKYIFELKDDWDDEGTIGYSKDTWEKAIKFLIKFAERILDNYKRVIYIPNIFHGKNGGIDILWEENDFRMLIRIDGNVEKATFYADDFKQQSSEGEFNIDSFSLFMLPLPINCL
jgi:hypothetical protein